MPDAEEYEQVLRYIAQPTMGYDGCSDIYECVAKASIDNVRLALVTCIRMAREVLQYDGSDRG